MLLTEYILFAMLALEMKNIDCKPDMCECRVISYDLGNLAVVVEEDVLRHGSGESISAFDHFLHLKVQMNHK